MAQVMSCNELGWENLSAEKTPVIVLVASSTGDGDAPDNAAKFYATMKCAGLWSLESRKFPAAVDNGCPKSAIKVSRYQEISHGLHITWCLKMLNCPRQELSWSHTVISAALEAQWLLGHKCDP